MTHTVYNRDRGPEETRRFLDILLKGIDPFREYARRHGLAIHLEGIREGYELEQEFNRAFPMPSHPKFDAHFLMDYEEEWFLSPDGRALLEALPPIDVVVRHTKLGISGGWIPIRMRKAAYVYSQNGTVHSNWNFNEYAAMVAVTYLAKLLNEGEALSKTYASIDEIKARYRDREIRLLAFQDDGQVRVSRFLDDQRVRAVDDGAQRLAAEDRERSPHEILDDIERRAEEILVDCCLARLRFRPDQRAVVERQEHRLDRIAAGLEHPNRLRDSLPADRIQRVVGAPGDENEQGRERWRKTLVAGQA